MRIRILTCTLLIAAAAVLAVPAQQLPPLPKPDRDGWITMFDGKNLTNWLPAINWMAQNGEIVLTERTDRAEHNDNYLWYNQVFGDFILDLEVKMVQGTNSGIFIRTGDPRNPVPTGIECQVGVTTRGPAAFGSPAPPRAGGPPAGGPRSGGGPASRGRVGAFYSLVVPKEIEAKPDVWHHFIVTAKGPMLSLEINGVKTAEINLDQYTDSGRNPDGSENKFTMPLRYFPRRGYIGLQDHGTPVSYRNLRIKPLSK